MQPEIRRLYEEDIRPLPAAERLELVARIAQDLAIAQVDEAPAKRSLLELEGLGAAIWTGVDPEGYVDELRDEWDTTPERV